MSMISSILPWSTPHQESPRSNQQSSSISRLLDQYQTPGIAPVSARVDPQLLQRESPALSIRDAWGLATFVATKATELTKDFVSHHIWGPRKKSWGIEMTIITSMFRNAGSQSHLTDVAKLRGLMHLLGWVPVPSDALVTPVTFKVHKRGLRGFLAKYDAVEDGRRELEGEWVIGRRLWQRLQTEFRASQPTVNPSAKRAKRSGVRLKERVILYLHGGAYYVFSAATHRVITIPLSKYTESRVFAINYRLAPETRFPGPLHDAVLAYLRLIKDLDIPPQNILVAGDSAGGGLSLALLMYLRDNNYPLPSGAILMSPWVDLTMSCDSWDSNAAFDVVPFPPDPTDHLNPVSCYLGPEGMEKYLTHPYASPLFGNFHGLPPLLVQVGEAEVLRDEITLLAHKATLAGVQVTHELYEDAVHVFQMFPFLEAALKSFSAARHFVHNILPSQQVDPSNPLEHATGRKLESELRTARSRLVSGLGEVETAGVPEFDKLQTDDNNDGASNTSEEDAVVMRAEVHPTTDVEEILVSNPATGNSQTESLGRLSRCNTVLLSKETIISGHRRLGNSISNLDEIRKSNTSPSTSMPTMDQPANSLESVISPPFSPTRSRLHMQHINSLATSQLAPPPTVRSRARVRSHADIKELCKQWAASGPANETTTYKPT